MKRNGMQLLLTLALALCLIWGAALAEETSIPEIVSNVCPGVARIVPVDEEGRETGASVSGVYFRKAEEGGYLATAAQGETFRVCWLDGTELEATAVGADPETGFTVLKFEESAPNGVHPVAFGDSDELLAGEAAVLVGNSATGRSGMATCGAVSYVDRDAGEILADLTAYEGFEGGALLNRRGEMIGLCLARGEWTTCLSTNKVQALADEILETGTVAKTESAADRPRLGIAVSDVDGPDEPMLKYPPAGVLVREVTEGSSAEEQGIHENDIITAVDGVRVTNTDALLDEIAGHEVGDTVTLKVYRYYDSKGNALSRYEEYDFEVELRAMAD